MVLAYMWSTGKSKKPWIWSALAGPSEVGDDGDDLVGRCAAGGVDHEQELEEVVQGREGGLHDEGSGSADGFVEGGLELAVAEVCYDGCAEVESEGLGYLLGQITGSSAGEDLDTVCVGCGVIHMVSILSFVFGCFCRCSLQVGVYHVQDGLLADAFLG